MPLYMDVHTMDHAINVDDVTRAHQDRQAQEQYDVRYLRYWVDERHGKVFCLVEAPSWQAARDVPRAGALAHRERNLPSPRGGLTGKWSSRAARYPPRVGSRSVRPSAGSVRNGGARRRLLYRGSIWCGSITPTDAGFGAPR